MNLKTQINILTSSSKEGHYTLIWKNDQELLHQIEKIVEAFSDSTESITPAKTISTTIINKLGSKISTYGGMEFDINSLLTGKPGVDDSIVKGIESILKAEDSKKGNHSITLNSDELYGLFSLSEFRKSKLDQIL